VINIFAALALPTPTPPGPQHRLAVIMFCCQLNLLWPCEMACRCICKDKEEEEKEGGAPAIEITDAAAASTMNRE